MIDFENVRIAIFLNIESNLKTIRWEGSLGYERRLSCTIGAFLRGLNLICCLDLWHPSTIDKFTLWQRVYDSETALW